VAFSIQSHAPIVFKWQMVHVQKQKQYIKDTEKVCKNENPEGSDEICCLLAIPESKNI